MSSKMILIILSYIVSKLARFFETQCIIQTAIPWLTSNCYTLQISVITSQYCKT